MRTSADTLDAIVELAGVQAANGGSPTPVVETNTLDLTALSAVTVTVPSGVTLPLGDFIRLGAVNQYAEASDNGVSRSASGAINDSGVVDTTGSGSFPATATIDIASLLNVPAVVDTASVTARAVTGVAALEAGNTLDPTCADLSDPADCRDYNIAGATLDVHSPLIADVLTGATSAAGTVDTTVNALSTGIVTDLLTGVTDSLTLLNTLIPGLSLVSNDLAVTVTSDLASTIVSDITKQHTLNGVTLDLAAGTVTVDLDQVITGGLNNQLLGTELLSAAVLTSITTSLGTLISDVTTELTDLLNNALNAATVEISGGVCLLEALSVCTAGLNLTYNGTLGELLDGTEPIGIGGTGLLAIPGLTALLSDVLANLIGALTDTTGALQTAVTGLGGTVTGLVGGLVNPLVNDLTPQLTAISTVLSLTVNEQEDDAVNDVYSVVALRASILGGSLATVDLGKASVGANALMVPSTSMTLISINPDHGPMVGGNTVTLTGTGFPADAQVVFDGTNVTPNSVATDGTSLTFTVPARTTSGAVQVAVTDGETTTDSLPYQFDAPSISATSPVAAGSNTTVTSRGWPADTEVTVQIHDADNNPVGSPVTVTSTSDGQFPAGTVLLVPAGTTAGSGYSVQAVDVYENSAVTDLVVTSSGGPTTESTPPPDGSTTQATPPSDGSTTQATPPSDPSQSSTPNKPDTASGTTPNGNGPTPTELSYTGTPPVLPIALAGALLLLLGLALTMGATRRRPLAGRHL